MADRMPGVDSVQENRVGCWGADTYIVREAGESQQWHGWSRKPYHRDPAVAATKLWLGRICKVCPLMTDTAGEHYGEV